MTPLCPPWLLGDWQQIHERHTLGQMPHALLLTGIPGIGKQAFARFLVAALLCRTPSRDHGACGDCDACRQLQAGSHADFRHLEPDGASHTIKVDAVRELVEWLQLSAPAGRYRLALIESADSMNTNAANGLLKTLEEPGDRAIIVLTADRAGALPATVRSRCQMQTLRLQDRVAASDWLLEQTGNPEVSALLASARGGPYQVLEHLQDDWQARAASLRKVWHDLLLERASVGRLADSLSELSTAECLDAFSQWTALTVRQNVSQEVVGADPATLALISAVRSRLKSEQWFTLYDRLRQLRRSDSASFKTQTVLEGLFADIRLMTNG